MLRFLIYSFKWVVHSVQVGWDGKVALQRKQRLAAPPSTIRGVIRMSYHRSGLFTIDSKVSYIRDCMKSRFLHERFAGGVRRALLRRKEFDCARQQQMSTECLGMRRGRPGRRNWLEREMPESSTHEMALSRRIDSGHLTRARLRDIFAERKELIAKYVPAETQAIHAQAVAELKTQHLAANILPVGAKAPAFELPDHDGKIVSSSDSARQETARALLHPRDAGARFASGRWKR